MKFKIWYMLLVMIAILPACDKENDDLVDPLTGDRFPQVILLADEGDGGLEDEDNFSFNITLADRQDPEGEELGGKVIPLAENVTVQFRITEFSGFNSLPAFIKGADAFYEIDDCTTSADQGISLNLVYNAATGTGSVTFPSGVEEIEVEFEVDENLFDDGVFNTSERSVSIQLVNNNSALPAGVTVNTTREFTYTVQDDEGIYGEWSLDVNDAVEFQRFKDMFGLINEDIRNLDAADVDEILIGFEFEEIKAIVVLNEMEQVTECGSTEMVNKIIEIEAGIEGIDDDSQDGELEFAETLEIAGGAVREYVYSGSFTITGRLLTLILKGEFDDDETDDIEIRLSK